MKRRPLTDDFRGDNNHLSECIKSLIEMSDDNLIVPHGIGGHARTLLAACYCRLNKATAATVTEK